MKIEIIKCPRGCAYTFQTKTEFLNHHVAMHERPLPERYGIELPPLGNIVTRPAVAGIATFDHLRVGRNGVTEAVR
jgi:hypothetical protein